MSIRLLAAALAAMAAFQSQQPTIRSGVDLIRLDVSVVDKRGRPVPGLRPEEFTVKIDGVTRTVSFATFYSAEERTSVPRAPTAVSTFVTNVTRTRGRVVVFVVDLESLTVGYEKVILETAGKLVEGLGSADLVGLVAIPNKTVELTLDHARVKAALESLRGLALQSRQRHALTVLEADGFEKHDTRLMAQVIQRECPRPDPICPREVEDDAKLLIFDANRRIEGVLTALTTLTDGLGQLETPKSIVLLSAGLPFTEGGRQKFRDLQRRSSETGIPTYVVHVEQQEMEASRARPAGISSLPRSDLAQGLTNIAGVTSGEYFAGVGKATGVFEQVQTEISSTYQLGIQATPNDADGRAHKIDVQVNGGGVRVKSRKEIIVAAATRPTPSLGDILAAPMPLSEAPLAASAYTTRGEEPSTLKVILLIQLLGAAVSEPLPAYAISISNAKDEQVFTASERTSLAGPLGARAVAGVQLAPGQYRLRAAVLDSSGKPGSIDMPLAIGLRQAGPYESSDLMLGQFTDQFAPATHLPAGTPITALIELYATDPQALRDVAVDLELRKSDNDALIGRGEATIGETPLDRRRAAAGQVSTAGLGPGEYDVSAIIRRGAVRVGIVSRRIAINTP